jgi:hypothetical protein
MKLGAYLIDNQAVGVDITFYEQAQLNGKRAFIAAETLTTDYRDITSIENWHTYGNNTGRDYRYVRDRIKELVIALGSGSEATGFDLLSPQEKFIAVEHKIGSNEQRMAVVGMDNNIKLGLQYHKRVSDVRQVRAAYAIAELYNRLPDHAEEILNEIMLMGGNLFITYAFFGREGTQEGDVYAGIVDYFYGREGTEFEGNGIAQKPWTPIGMTMLQLVDKLYDIVIKGNY